MNYRDKLRIIVDDYLKIESKKEVNIYDSWYNPYTYKLQEYKEDATEFFERDVPVLFRIIRKLLKKVDNINE